jgi:hypothetical protein
MSRDNTESPRMDFITHPSTHHADNNRNLYHGKLPCSIGRDIASLNNELLSSRNRLVASLYSLHFTFNGHSMLHQKPHKLPSRLYLSRNNVRMYYCYAIVNLNLSQVNLQYRGPGDGQDYILINEALTLISKDRRRIGTKSLLSAFKRRLSLKTRRSNTGQVESLWL